MITLRSFHALFQRYSALHRHIPLLSRKIYSKDGTLVARIEKEGVVGNMHRLRGWTFAQQIVLETENRVILTVGATVPRSDVQAHYGGVLNTGFDLQIPDSTSQCDVTFVNNGIVTTRRLRRPWRIVRILEGVRLGAGLGWAGVRGLPAIRAYLTSTDAQVRDAAKQRLKQLMSMGGRALQRDHLFGPWEIGAMASPAMKGKANRLTIVLPVYNAFELLCECLARVVAHTDADWHVILIEDCSTDPRIRPYLREWTAKHSPDRATLLENDSNLGFIGAVNRGFELALKRGVPIVLLNSDALVPKGWASRLLAPLASLDVASATPMSNDAEILNTPVICHRETLVPGQADLIDTQARVLLANALPVTLPTGVGFCMAISPHWLERVPEFDPIFGRGYGEEVDWCRKIMRMGGRHVGVPNLFVEHRGGVSFGSDEKRRLIEANGRIVTSRHVGFDAEVQEFIASDPLIGPRLILGLTAVSTNREVPVYLCHSLGGGAEDAMMRQVRKDLSQGLASVILRVGGRFRYGVELYTPEGITYGNTEEEAALEHLWRAIPRMHLIYICGVGDADAPSLPERMVHWASDASVRLTIEIHDFFPLSPSYTLLDGSCKYQGPPIAGADDDAAHRCRDREGRVIGLSEWQAGWRKAMVRADHIVVFSKDSHNILLAVWPDLVHAIVVQPHPPLHEVPPIVRDARIPARTIGVLGNIGRQKGAEVLAEMSRQLSPSEGEGLVLIGNIDPTYPLSHPALIHGSYAREDIATLAENYGIDCWLIPSIWPETFCFTIREALATGLPVWCFDLGAQAEALRAAGQDNHILPTPSHPDEMRAILDRILDGEARLR